MLELFGIKKYCTDDWGAYERHISEKQHEIGKKKTQQIERKHFRIKNKNQAFSPTYYQLF